MKILFAHGFEGSHGGTKPRYLRETLGHQVTAPTMYARGWTFQGHVEMVLDALDHDPEIEVVIGSSMGGFASAVALAQRKERAVRALLLAPAVGIHDAWAQSIGPEEMRAWAELGQRPYLHRGLNEHIELPYELWSQCRDAAEVSVTHPCIIVHGVRDTVVPIERSEALAARSSGVLELVRIDDEHRLHEALPHLSSILDRLMA